MVYVRKCEKKRERGEKERVRESKRAVFGKKCQRKRGQRERKGEGEIGCGKGWRM